MYDNNIDYRIGGATHEIVGVGDSDKKQTTPFLLSETILSRIGNANFTDGECSLLNFDRVKAVSK